MKLRQAQTSATYLLPDPGELDKRVSIRQRVDSPSDDMGTEPTYPVQLPDWAKVVHTSDTTYALHHYSLAQGDHYGF